MQPRKLLAKDTRVVVLVAILLIVISLPAVVTAHGGGPTNSVVHACVNSNSGEVKIVSADDECSGNWDPLDWNQAGQPGEDGVSGYERTTVNVDDEVLEGQTVSQTVLCPVGKVVLGGGAVVEENDRDFHLLSSYPSGDSDRAWTVSYQNTGRTTERKITFYAICATVN